MKELKKIDVMSAGKTSLMFGAFSGILMALFLFGFGSAISMLSSITGEGTDVDTASRLTMNLMAIFYLVFTPIAGFIGGVIYAWLYNPNVRLALSSREAD